MPLKPFSSAMNFVREYYSIQILQALSLEAG